MRRSAKPSGNTGYKLEDIWKYRRWRRVSWQRPGVWYAMNAKIMIKTTMNVWYLMREVAVHVYSTSPFLCYASISVMRSFRWILFWKEIFWADRAQSTVSAAMLCSSPEATVRNTAGSVRLRSDADRKRNTREKCAVLWNIRTSGARINTDFFQADLMPDDNYILKPEKRVSNGLQ